MIVYLPRPLKPKDKGQDVLMVKRALSVAGYRPWGFGFTETWGSYMTKNVTKFKKDHGISEADYGPKTHKALAHFFDAYGANVMLHIYKANLVTPIDIACKANIVAHNNSHLNAYTQKGGRMQIIRDKINSLLKLTKFYEKNRVLYEDCSSFQTGASYIAGLKDPNGFDYNGQGYTGTLSLHGRRVWPPKKGDLAFYGAAWPYHHVVRALEDGTVQNKFHPMCGSHGRPGFDLEKSSYRNDLNHWRRY